MVKDLNLSSKTLRRNHRGKLHDTGFSNDFLDMTPKAQATKGKKINRTSKFNYEQH